MFAVLGAVFRDEAGRPVAAGGGSLHLIHTMDLGGLPELARTEVVIASDVQNPLTGPGRGRRRLRADEGAPTRPRCRRSMRAPPTSSTGSAPPDGPTHPGWPPLPERLQPAAGFAGLLLGGRAVSEDDYFLDLLRFEARLDGRDLVVTGEGRIDDGPCTASCRPLSPGAPHRSRWSRSSGAATSATTPGNCMGLARRARHRRSDRRQPGGRSSLSARLLDELGRTMPLPSYLTETP